MSAEDVIEALKELGEDATVPRNVKERVNAAAQILGSDEDMSIKVHRALHELEEISDDTNLQPYTRTQVWNIVSMLEKL